MYSVTIYLQRGDSEEAGAIRPAGRGGAWVGGGAVSPACVNTSDKDARSYSMGIIHDNIFTFGFTLISRDQVCLSL